MTHKYHTVGIQVKLLKLHIIHHFTKKQCMKKL